MISQHGEPLPKDRLAVALDAPTLDAALGLARQVAPHAAVFKIGLELFTQCGPGAVAEIAKLGAVFLDLKLHDIPETVERAVGRARDLGVRYLTVHASGGPEMLRRAAHAADGSPLTLLAVTVLTSLTDEDLAATGVSGGAAEHAARLAALAWGNGVQGFVCSPLEVAALHARHPGATIVTPGIRSASDAHADQKRVGTPGDAVRAGASVLVVGRPIRDAASPRDAAARIEREIEEALIR